MDGAKALLHATNPFLLDRRGAAPAAPAGELIFPPFNATAAPRRRRLRLLRMYGK